MMALKLTGCVFGRLTVLEKGPNRGKNTTWVCRCDCGTTKTIITEYLTNGTTRSCGCLHKEIARTLAADLNKPLPNGQAAFNYLLYVYKTGAKKRGLLFELTVEEFRSLTQGNCNYCGAAPNHVMSQRNSHYTYNGVDRYDNSLGYIQSNCVSCCTTCNSMKSTLLAEDFLMHCIKVTRWNENEN